MNPLISVVIPAYNVGKYLTDCIKSVLSQSMNDFEAIVIDDGSPDDCGRIADAFALADARVRVIHKQNGGVSRARNDGIDSARGEWIWFVDGDDMVAEGAFAALRNVSSADADMVLFEHEMFPAKRHQTYSHTVTPLGEAEMFELRRQSVYARGDSALTRINLQSASYCIYRTSFLRAHTLRFRPALVKWQDSVFNFLALTSCRKAVHLDLPLLLYRRHAGSISVRFSENVEEYMQKALNAYEDIIQTHYTGDDEMRIRMLLRRVCMVRPVLFLYFCNARNPHSWRERRAEFLAFLSKPEIQEAYKHINLLTAGFIDRAVYAMIRRKAFFPLDFLYRVYSRKTIVEG